MSKNAKINNINTDDAYGSTDSIFDTNLFAQLESRKGYNNTSVNDTLNPYVNFNDHSASQSLHDMMSAEAIQMWGIKCVYLRRNMHNVDLVLGEDPLSVFEDNFTFAAYLESFSGWEGAGDNMSIFGLVVNDEVSLIVNDKLFKHQGDGEQLAEGDLIYFPRPNSLFEITWVEQENSEFYQVGSIPNRKVTATKFVYSGEEINVTGTPDELEELIPVSNLENAWHDSLIPGEEMQEMIDEFEDMQQEVSALPNQAPILDLDDEGYIEDDINTYNNPFDNNF